MLVNGYLLDTNVLLRLDRQVSRVSRAILELLEDPAAELFVSAVSFWELAIKQGIGKMDEGLRLEPVLRTYGMRELPVTARYADAVRRLPALHRDPFDRMIVAQAIEDGMVLVTADRRLAEYPVAMLRV